MHRLWRAVLVAGVGACVACSDGALGPGADASAGTLGSGTDDDDDDGTPTTSISESGASDGQSSGGSDASSVTEGPTSGAPTSTGPDATSDPTQTTTGASDSTGEDSADGSTTEPAEETTGSGPTIGYGDCVNQAAASACITTEVCILDDVADPLLGVCGEQGCSDAGDCPDPPAGGDAVATCREITGNAVNDCYLDCSGGQACPTGMRCAGGFICAYDLAGADPIGFGDCTGGATDACLFDEVCLTEAGGGAVCTLPDCGSAADCPQPPPAGSGNAPIACADINADGDDECVLRCNAGQTCPDGMFCFGGSVCMWS